MPRKISGKELAADIRSGLHDNEIMAKYGLAPSELAKLKPKLEAAGLMPQVVAPTQRERGDPGVRACPQCGAPFPLGAVKCPVCTRQAASNLPPDPVPSPRPTDKLPGDIPAFSPLTKDYTRRRVLRLVIPLAIGLIALSAYSTRGRDEARVLAELRPTLQQLTTEDPLQVDWPATVTGLNEVKARHKGLLGGWTGSYEDLLQLCTEMVGAHEAMAKIVEAELQKQEEIKAQEEAVKRKMATGENAPADLQIMRGLRHRAEASARLEGPLIRLSPEKGRFNRLTGEIRDLCRKKLSP